jgi:V-type H+-transporting ATPase subunit a
MGSLYRSEPTHLYQLFLQSDSAYSCMLELGELGLVQFKDLNPDVNQFQRKFVNELRRCDEMERKLRFLEKECKKDGIKVAKGDDENPTAPLPGEINSLEVALEKLEMDLKEVNTSSEALKTNLLDLIELKCVLTKTKGFFEENNQEALASLNPESGQTAQDNGKLGFFAGVILRERLQSFERLLWRACRGNVLLKQADIETPLEQPSTGIPQWKAVFLIFYQGDHLKDKIKKICDGFRATLYPCPEAAAERREMAEGVDTRIKDLEMVLKQTNEHRAKILVGVAKSLKVWFTKVIKVKGIYFTLNLLNIDLTQKCLIGECWIPDVHVMAVQQALSKGTARTGAARSAAILNCLETKEQPPTYNRTNKFTHVFQGIVNSYGIATYSEVNPAPFTIVSFPFLFSMMFGDTGHGLLVFLAGLMVVLMEKRLMKNKSNNEIWNIFFGGRYIILLMGLFSVYAGLMYNDIFSKSANIFGSAWYPEPVTYTNSVLSTQKEMTLDPNTTDYNRNPYPFGLDPVWQLSLNKITFLNSFKMKISIIFGISQMTFGVILSLQNHRYFKDPVNIFCEFIPEMLFLMSIFGYLIVLILYKWITWTAADANCAPSLLIDLINMFLFNYPNDPCGSQVFYDGQKTFQTILLLIVVACIPWLLIPKPFLLKRRHNKQKQKMGNMAPSPMNSGIEMQASTSKQVHLAHYDDIVVDVKEDHDEKEEKMTIEKPVVKAAARPAHHDPHGGEFDFGDIFVHQCIHTIEFCLGCISHTASYLRLWALSLAHAELSEVLWSMVLHNGFALFGGYLGIITIFIIFTPWAVLTVAILLLMEGLSAFLHTLRLHWVEFQSKFYKGEGYLFEPFSFRKLQRLAEADG